MAKSDSKLTPLPFPVNGLVRRFAFDQQPPGSTSAAQNVRPTDTFQRRWRGGSRPGMTLAYPETLAGRVQGFGGVSLVTDGALSRRLVVAAGGNLYSDYTPGHLNSIEDDLDADLPCVQMAERGQLLYIVGWATDAPPLVYDPSDDSVIPLAAQSFGDPWATNTDYNIGDNAVQAGTSYQCQIPHKSGTFATDLSAGDWVVILNTVPTGCTCCCIYRDRLVLAGPAHLWYMSRQGYPGDWMYGADPGDAGRAVSATNSFSGSPGKPITALIPHGNDCMIFGSADELWILRGDPTYGGTLTALDNTVGVLGPNAWCSVPGFGAVFLAADGLYIIPNTCSGIPQPLTWIDLPEELRNVDPTASAISLEYDPDHHGVSVSITPLSTGVGQHWWIHYPALIPPVPGVQVERQSFWPVVFGDDEMQPTSMYRYDGSPGSTQHCFVGCRDGGVRYFDDSATDDDGEAIVSSVSIGPFRISGSPYY
jgi:hypothetical protein